MGSQLKLFRVSQPSNSGIYPKPKLPFWWESMVAGVFRTPTGHRPLFYQTPGAGMTDAQMESFIWDLAA